MAFIQNGNLIILPIDTTAVVLQIQEDKTLKPLTANSEDTAEFVLNGVRRIAFEEIEYLRSGLKELEMSKRLADTVLEYVKEDHKRSSIQNALDRAKESEKRSIRTLSVFEEFMLSSLEVMMEYNVPVKQLSSPEGAVVENSDKTASDFLARLKGKL